MEKLKLYYPIKKFYFGQRFGANQVSFYRDMGMPGHNGIDIPARDGQTIRASHDGVVTFAGEDGSGGLGVVIRTDKEYEYEGGSAFYKTIYWHLKTGSIIVKASQKVKAGDKIAEADNTGRSTGTHLHFALKPIKQGEAEWVWENIEQNNGYKGAIDPEPYFIGKYAEDIGSIITPIKDFFTKTLKYGMKNDEVLKLQKKLSYKYNITPDGIFGRKTLQAIREFQKENGLIDDGIVGARTREILNQI